MKSFAHSGLLEEIEALKIEVATYPKTISKGTCGECKRELPTETQIASCSKEELIEKIKEKDYITEARIVTNRSDDTVTLTVNDGEWWLLHLVKEEK